MSSTGSARTPRLIVRIDALHCQQRGTVKADKLNGAHAVFMDADHPAGECYRPAVRPLQGTFDKIVGVRTVKSV